MWSDFTRSCWWFRSGLHCLQAGCMGDEVIISRHTAADSRCQLKYLVSPKCSEIPSLAYPKVNPKTEVTVRSNFSFWKLCFSTCYCWGTFYKPCGGCHHGWLVGWLAGWLALCFSYIVLVGCLPACFVWVSWWHSCFLWIVHASLSPEIPVILMQQQPTLGTNSNGSNNTHAALMPNVQIMSNLYNF